MGCSPRGDRVISLPPHTSMGVLMAVDVPYVRFVEGVSKKLHFTDHKWVYKEIKDPLTGWTKRIRTLVLKVDWEDGRHVDKTLSVTSSKLQQMLLPYLDGKRYKRYLFEIRKRGSGFLTEWEMRTIPFPSGAGGAP